MFGAGWEPGLLNGVLAWGVCGGGPWAARWASCLQAGTSLGCVEERGSAAQMRQWAVLAATGPLGRLERSS